MANKELAKLKRLDVVDDGILIDQSGNIHNTSYEEYLKEDEENGPSEGWMELAFEDLENLAKASALVATLAKSGPFKQVLALNPPESTYANGYDISFIGEGQEFLPEMEELDGSVWIGCQQISAKDVQRVYQTALKMRNANKRKRK